ncbi:formin-like protein [Acrasis kona]|uniref:Formin-like protein n=1 Tax=Acrasis kona TaxID=1008807 RepID=A0AAW2Z975_9EUKA
MQEKLTQEICKSFGTRVMIFNFSSTTFSNGGLHCFEVAQSNLLHHFERITNLFSMCDAMHSYLSSNPGSVIVVHTCPRSVTYAALLTACYLSYTDGKRYKNSIDAYIELKNNPTVMQLVEKSTLNCQPSIFRYARFFSMMTQMPMPCVRKLALTSLRMNSLLTSLSTNQTGSRQSPHNLQAASKKPVYSSNTANLVPVEERRDGQLWYRYDIDVPCELFGDFMLYCYRVVQDSFEKVFRYTYSTFNAFMHDVLTVKKTHLDWIDCAAPHNISNRHNANNNCGHIPNDFMMQLSFKDNPRFDRKAANYAIELEKCVRDCPSYYLKDPKVAHSVRLQHINVKHRHSMHKVLAELSSQVAKGGTRNLRQSVTKPTQSTPVGKVVPRIRRSYTARAKQVNNNKPKEDEAFVTPVKQKIKQVNLLNFDDEDFEVVETESYEDRVKRQHTALDDLLMDLSPMSPVYSPGKDGKKKTKSTRKKFNLPEPLKPRVLNLENADENDEEGDDDDEFESSDDSDSDSSENENVEASMAKRTPKKKRKTKKIVPEETQDKENQEPPAVIAVPPPPPPPPVMCAPPPPPPPPPMMKAGPPPPPLSNITNSQQLVINTTKQLFWKPINMTPESDSPSVWSEVDLNPEDVVNIQELEKLFSKNNNVPTPSTPRPNSGTVNEPNTPRAVDHVPVLDSNVERKLEIVITSSFKSVGADQIVEFIDQLDLNNMSLERIEHCANFVTVLDKEKKETLALRYQQEKYMSKVEKFLYVLCECDRISDKLDAMKSMHCLEPIVHDVRNMLQCKLTACNVLFNNASFGRMLHYVLLVGNALNRGKKGIADVKAFHLNILPKLIDTKSSCGGDQDQGDAPTLLHYLIKLVEEKEPEVLNFYADLESNNVLFDACKITLELITIHRSEVKNMCRYLTKECTQRGTTACCETGPDGVKRLFKMRDDAVKWSEEIDGLIDNYKNSYCKLLQYFVYEPDKNSNENDAQDAFFVTIRDFVSNFKIAREQRQKWLLKEKQKKKRSQSLIERTNNLQKRIV